MNFKISRGWKDYLTKKKKRKGKWKWGNRKLNTERHTNICFRQGPSVDTKISGLETGYFHNLNMSPPKFINYKGKTSNFIIEKPGK